jgi:anti-sigma B factor antagonist
MVFDYNLSKHNSINVFSLKGELIDRTQANKLLEDIDSCIAKNENKILLDLGELKYINSSGLNVMINILTRTRKAGGDLAVCCINKKINELLVITKLNNVFNISENIETGTVILNK